MNMFTKLEAS